MERFGPAQCVAFVCCTQGRLVRTIMFPRGHDLHFIKQVRTGPVSNTVGFWLAHAAPVPHSICYAPHELPQARDVV